MLEKCNKVFSRGGGLIKNRQQVSQIGMLSKIL